MFVQQTHMAYQSYPLVRNQQLGECNFSPSWFVTQLAAPLLKPVPADARERVASMLKLQSSQQQPYDLHHEVQNKTPGDAQEWTPSFGDSLHGEDNFVSGVFYSDPSTGGDGRHWLVIRAGTDHVGEQLHQFVLDNPQMSVGEFVQTRQYNTAKRYATRNARRLGALIAGALVNDHQGLEDLIECEPDTMSRTRGNLLPPMLIKPTHFYQTNALEHDSLPRHIKQSEQLYYLGNDVTASDSATSPVLKLIDARRGFLLHRATPGANQNDWLHPIAPADTYDRQEDNEDFWRTKQLDKGRLHKQHVHQKYLNRQGEVPSSASKPLWNQRWIGDQVPDYGVRLTPHVVIIHGKQARGA